MVRIQGLGKTFERLQRTRPTLRGEGGAPWRRPHVELILQPLYDGKWRVAAALGSLLFHAGLESEPGRLALPDEIFDEMCADPLLMRELERNEGVSFPTREIIGLIESAGVFKVKSRREMFSELSLGAAALQLEETGDYDRRSFLSALALTPERSISWSTLADFLFYHESDFYGAKGFVDVALLLAPQSPYARQLAEKIEFALRTVPVA